MDPEADALYALPAAEFTAGRDALAARLRAEGRRDEAAEVKALRRPTVGAAAINRAVRAHPEALDELLTAARNLARAQERLLAGEGDRAVLRESAEHVREAISALAAIAVAADGLSAASADRVRATLQAAVADEDVREEVRAGRLVREAEAGAVGFPAVAPGSGGPSPRGTGRAPAGEGSSAGRRAGGPARGSRSGSGGGRAAEADARDRAREAAERLKAASRAVREVQRQLTRVEQRIERTSSAADDLRDRLKSAEAEAAEAAREAEELRSRLRAAKAEEAAAHEAAG